MTEKNPGAEAFLEQIRAEQAEQAERFKADPEAKARFEAEQAEWERLHEEAGARTVGPSAADIRAALAAGKAGGIEEIRKEIDDADDQGV